MQKNAAMEMPKPTVRFAQVVKECGREPVTLWRDPKKVPEFQAALRGHRVMTVVQATVGTRKDFGLVGFHRLEHASRWVFPKALGKFEGNRIIGIKYDLLACSSPHDPVKAGARPAPNPMEKPLKESAPPRRVNLSRRRPNPSLRGTESSSDAPPRLKSSGRWRPSPRSKLRKQP
jgi:hypothetical protein